MELYRSLSIGQKKESIMGLTNRERGEHCSSTSLVVVLFFVFSLFPLSWCAKRTREREREKEENPVVAVDQTRMHVLDERESMLEEKERAKKRRMVVVREEN